MHAHGFLPEYESMSQPCTFAEFVRRIRAGDEAAAAELVRQYEPLIRREVRLRLENGRLGQVLESLDICQSVLASFFVRTAAGQFELDCPEQLLKLLVRMARNKLASAARYQHRLRRDQRRLTAGGSAVLAHVAAAGPSPSDLVACRELLQRLLAVLSPDEKRLAELRGQGLAWADIAQEVGGTPQARRVQLARAVGRAARQLGLDEDRHE